MLNVKFKNKDIMTKKIKEETQPIETKIQRQVQIIKLDRQIVLHSEYPEDKMDYLISEARKLIKEV